LPVIVWIHGGGFQQGGSQEGDPVKLMKSSKNPFVFVSIQYRLGEFGFLAGTGVQEGGKGDANVGLLDQVSTFMPIMHNVYDIELSFSSEQLSDGYRSISPNSVGILGEYAGILLRLILIFCRQVTIWGQSAGGGDSCIQSFFVILLNARTIERRFNDVPSTFLFWRWKRGLTCIRS